MRSGGVAPRREAARAGKVHEIGEPLGLGSGGLPARRRDAVVPAPFVGVVRVGTVVELDDQPGVEHVPDGSVQRAGSQPDPAPGSLGNSLKHGVSMLVTLGEDQEDVKDRG